MTERALSKSQFKARALEHLRQVAETGKELIITDRGTPVVKVVPYDYDPMERLKSLRGTVKRFDDPTEPVGTEDWEVRP